MADSWDRFSEALMTLLESLNDRVEVLEWSVRGLGPLIILTLVYCLWKIRVHRKEQEARYDYLLRRIQTLEVEISKEIYGEEDDNDA